MSGAGIIVTRDFRGTQMFLATVTRDGFTWTADKARARRFESIPAAMAASERAFAEWGADSAVIDESGSVLVRSRAAIAAGHPLGVLRHHVTGAILRGEAQPIEERRE